MGIDGRGENLLLRHGGWFGRRLESCIVGLLDGQWVEKNYGLEYLVIAELVTQLGNISLDYS
jgi:hypothetical protein